MKKLITLLSIVLLLFLSPISIKASIIRADETYSYNQMQEDLWRLKNKYKRQISVYTFGYSEYGRKLYAIRLGDGTKSILLSGAHHGREWITSLLLMKMTEDQAISLKNRNFYLDNYSIWIIPMINPDGVTIQQGDLHKFPVFARKSLKEMNEGSDDFIRWKSNGRGIDLNRQYSVGWKNLKNTRKNPAYKNYKGKRPFEAKEVKALVRLTKKIKPTIAVAYHSSGQEIFWQYKNELNLERDKQIAEKIANLTGYKLGIPNEDAIGAGYTDWFISKYHLPALTIEICPLVEETSPPLDTFTNEWESNKGIVEVLLHEAKKIESTHKKTLEYR